MASPNYLAQLWALFGQQPPGVGDPYLAQLQTAMQQAALNQQVNPRPASAEIFGPLIQANNPLAGPATPVPFTSAEDYSRTAGTLQQQYPSQAQMQAQAAEYLRQRLLGPTATPAYQAITNLMANPQFNQQIMDTQRRPTGQTYAQAAGAQNQFINYVLGGGNPAIWSGLESTYRIPGAYVPPSTTTAPTSQRSTATGASEPQPNPPPESAEIFGPLGRAAGGLGPLGGYQNIPEDAGPPGVRGRERPGGGGLSPEGRTTPDQGGVGPGGIDPGDITGGLGGTSTGLGTRVGPGGGGAYMNFYNSPYHLTNRGLSAGGGAGIYNPSGVNTAGLQGLLDQLSSQYGGVFPGVFGPAEQTRGGLEQFYAQNPPGGYLSSLASSIGGLTQPRAGTDELNNLLQYLSNPASQANISGQNGLLGTMMSNLQYLNQYGLPGTQQLQSEMGGQGQTAQALLGGTGQQFLAMNPYTGQMEERTNWGLNDAINSILNRGLPGQTAIEMMAPRGIQQGYNLLGQAQNIGEGMYGLGAPLTAAYQGLMRNPPQVQGVPNVAAGGVSLPYGATGALGQQANRLFNTQYQFGVPEATTTAGNYANRLAQFQPQAGTAQQPGFFGDLISRAFGAGQGLQAPTIQAPGQISAPGIQGGVENALQGLIQGGGLSPEYVQATRQRVLGPAQQALVGRINQQMGGREGALGSGVSQELQRRQEADFNADLIRQGFQNLQTTLGQGAQLGAQQFGQGQQNIQNQMQAALANQQAALQTQGLGVGAGLQGLGLLPSLASADVQRQLGNVGNQLQAAGLGAGNLGQAAQLQAGIGQFLPTLQQRGAELGLQATGLGAGLLGQQAGLEAQLGQFAPQLQLQAALANQAAQQRAGETNINAYLQSIGLGGQLQGQAFGQQLNQGQFLGGLGQNALNTALAGFQGVAGAAAPYYGLAGTQAQNAMQNALNRYDVLAGRGLQNIETIGRLGYEPLQIAQEQQRIQQQAAAQQMGGYQQLLSSLLGGGQQFLGGQQQFALGMADLPTSLARAFLSGEQQRTIAQIARDAQISAANQTALGSIAAGGIAVLPQILRTIQRAINGPTAGPTGPDIG